MSTLREKGALKVGILTLLLSSLCIQFLGLEAAKRFLLEFLYLALVSLIALAMWGSRRYVLRPKREAFLLAALGSYTVFLATNANQLRPAVFFFALASMCCYLSSVRPTLDIKTVRMISLGYVALVCASLTFSGSYLNGRFASFPGSPTVLSVILLLLLAIYTSTTRSKVKIVGFYIVIGLLIFLTRTRLSIALWAVAPLVAVLSAFSTRKKIFVYIFGMIMLIAGYPIFDYVSSTDQAGYVTRDVGAQGDDASFGLRRAMTNLLLDDFNDSSATRKIIGKGAEAARDLIKNNYDSDLLPHNDYLRLVFDFGVPFSFAYIFFLFRLVIPSKSFSVNFVFIVYLVSFYHNMVYFLLCPLTLAALVFCKRPGAIGRSPVQIRV